MRTSEPDPMAHRGVFKVSADPSTIDHMRQKCDLRGGGGAKIKVGRPSGGAGGALGVNTDELEAPGHDPAVTGLVSAAINDRMLQIDQHVRHHARIVLVDQHGTLPEQAVVALDDQVHRPVEQRMTWCHVLSQRPALRQDETLLKRHALVLAQHGSTRTDLTVTAAQFYRDMADLEPARLALPDDSTYLPEGRQKEGSNEVRLEFPGFCALHSSRIRSTSPVVMTSLTSARSWTT